MLEIFRRWGSRKPNNLALQPDSRHSDDRPRYRPRYSMEVKAEIIKGTYADGNELIRQVASSSEVTSGYVRGLPLSDSDRMLVEGGSKKARRWVVVILMRQLLEANSTRPLGDTVMPEAFEEGSLELLVARINKRIAGWEVQDVQIFYDEVTGHWLASVYFPYSLRLQQII